MPTTTFRAATATDVPAVVELVTSAYRGEASRAGWTTEADLLDGNRIVPEVLFEDIARPRSRILLAERRGELVGCAHVEARGDRGYFGMFAVRPTLQGSGLGGAILAEAERIAREEWRLPLMRMTVIDVRTELIAWYERRGYALTGEERPFPSDDPRFGIPRRDDLIFAVMEKRL